MPRHRRPQDYPHAEEEEDRNKPKRALHRHTVAPLILDATSPARSTASVVWTTHKPHDHPPSTQPTAASLAQQAPHSGFLRKKHERRFYVLLPPTTTLYSFASPHDTDPKGCLDVTDAAVTVDGEYLDLQWSGARTLVTLQAPTAAQAQQWAQQLHQQKFDPRKLHKLELYQQAAQCRIRELEQALLVRKLVEQDRDGALEDARQWKERYEALHENVRLLGQDLKRSRSSDTEDDAEDTVDSGDTDATFEPLPDTHMVALTNVCQQLREQCRLAADEASTAVQDLTKAQAETQALQQRMTKAEQHLCKIWEENCAVRKELQQRKKEKKVLVREVKALREATPDMDEEKLVEELEEHLTASMKLHEKLLGSSSLAEMRNLGSIELADSTDTPTTKNPRSLPVASLFDSDEEDDSVVPSDVSSICAEASEPDTPERPNPIAQLDAEDSPEPPAMCPTSSNSESSSRSNQATTKLQCPLADVVETTQHGNESTQGLHMYHLTFYSRKIGIQFQKVPPPPRKPRGLLTDALTTDLEASKSTSSPQAELERISAIAKVAKEDRDTNECPVASPVDAVIVCGFQGFDDSSGNVRPKLGARLVAFDGVSVEVGRWTFDDIRKAIQIRSRPMTLSFRNDFLTTEQRTILTRAVKEVDEHYALPRRTIQFQEDEPSVRSGDSDRPHGFRPARHLTTPHQPRDADDWSGTSRNSHPASFSARSFRSFSEAGSSVSALSATLVANLMRKEPFTPEYLTREAKAVEETPQYLDFQSELL